MSHTLYYNPFVPVDSIIPVQTLKKALATANHAMRKPDPNFYELDVLANLVRLNWMVEDLRTGIIQKPLLLRTGLEIVTGDTRMMAIKLSNAHQDVPALLTVSKQESVSDDWIEIEDNSHLAELVRCTTDEIQVRDDWHEKELDWIEFAMSHTAHHMHDQLERETMIFNYIEEQDSDFVFTEEWFHSPIDWRKYSNS